MNTLAGWWLLEVCDLTIMTARRANLSCRRRDGRWEGRQETESEESPNPDSFKRGRMLRRAYENCVLFFPDFSFKLVIEG